MANTYTSLNYHLVFSTKNREPLLIASVCERLWPYLGGIARENGMKALEIICWSGRPRSHSRFGSRQHSVV